MAIPFITELRISAGAEEELAAHGLDAQDALEVEWNGPAFFRDKVDGRYRMIGKNDEGALLTIIVEPAHEQGCCDVVTGWKATKGERTVWQKRTRS